MVFLQIGKTFTSATSRVRLAPKIPKRVLVPLPTPKLTTAPGKFSVVTYNLLADLYTNVSAPSSLLSPFQFSDVPGDSFLVQLLKVFKAALLTGMAIILH